MRIEDFTKEYGAKSDEELLLLATALGDLTPTAQLAISGELARRRIDFAEHSSFAGRRKIEPEDSPAILTRDPTHARQFVPEVLRLYHNHFWLFVRLIAPAVVVGYLAMRSTHHEVLEIYRHLPRGVEVLQHKTELLEISCLNQIGYLVSWIAFGFSFGAISSAVREIGRGVSPGFQESFATVRWRMLTFLGLSLLLYCTLLLLFFISGLLSFGVLWIAHKIPIPIGRLTAQFVGAFWVGLALLVLSRFGLAIPAIVLDKCRITQAVVRSDELTERKWLILATLLFKSLVGGYVAAMVPYWVASRIPAGVFLPDWFPWLLSAISIAAVVVVEPTMFIGFALLYVRMATLAEPGPVRIDSTYSFLTDPDTTSS